MDIRALKQLEDARQLKALVHEYLDHELIQLKALSGLAFETATSWPTLSTISGITCPRTGPCTWPRTGRARWWDASSCA